MKPNRDSLQAGQPEIRWRDIAAFRNTLVHDYLSINLEQIWQIVTNDMPLFRQQIEAMIVSMNQA